MLVSNEAKFKDNKEFDSIRLMIVVYAWGNSIVEPSELRNLITSPLCFGKNINGSPKHPLYLSSKSKLIKFR